MDELIKTEADLTEIADFLLADMGIPIREGAEPIVSRYMMICRDSAMFINGKKRGNTGGGSVVNTEFVHQGRYTMTHFDDFFPHNFREVAVARNLSEARFRFHHKDIQLPTEQMRSMEELPSAIDMYDDEFRQFTKDHPNTRISRELEVEHRVILNSNGGVAIQRVPFFTLHYSHGYSPIPSSRALRVVCTSDEDLRNLPQLIQYIADPTLDKRVKKAKTFCEAFHELHKITPLRYGSLEEAGIPLQGLYDVVMLTGVPVHEIFGHQFEEPIRYLNAGECGTFRAGQQVTEDSNIILRDNPYQRVAGFRTSGFTHFDAYGRRRKIQVHIKDGKVQGFLGSEYVDQDKLMQYLHIERSSVVGHGAQYNDGAFPQPRMTCTVLDGQPSSIDLEGKILVVAHTGHTNPNDKTYVVNAEECYVIRNGEPQRVIPLMITGGINQALANLTLLEGRSYQIGMCGKPNPIQRESNASTPVSQFTRDQMWGQQQVYPLPIHPKHLAVLIRE